LNTEGVHECLKIEDPWRVWFRTHPVFVPRMCYLLIHLMYRYWDVIFVIFYLK
jgi:hypothetical protein